MTHSRSKLNVFWSKRLKMYHFDGIYFNIKGVDYKLVGVIDIDGKAFDEFKDISTGKFYKMERNELGEKLIKADQK